MGEDEGLFCSADYALLKLQGYLNNQEALRRGDLEVARMIMWSNIQVHSKDKKKFTDIMVFDWEKPKKKKVSDLKRYESR